MKTIQNLLMAALLAALSLGAPSQARAQHGDADSDEKSGETSDDTSGDNSGDRRIRWDPLTPNARRVVTIQYLASGGDYEGGIGFGYYHYPPKDIGMFLNFQVGTKKGEPYYETLGLGSFGDPVLGRYKDPLVINVGATKSFGKVGLFAGLGYGATQGVARKYDPLHILAKDGVYFVDDPEFDESGVNFTAGGTIDLGRMSMDIGFNSFTSSAYVGAGWNF